jgi:hypothetical protein
MQRTYNLAKNILLIDGETEQVISWRRMYESHPADGIILNSLFFFFFFFHFSVDLHIRLLVDKYRK